MAPAHPVAVAQTHVNSLNVCLFLNATRTTLSAQRCFRSHMCLRVRKSKFWFQSKSTSNLARYRLEHFLNQRVEIGAVTSWWLRGNEIKKELPRLSWALGYSVTVKPICFDIFYDFIDNKKWSMRLFPLTCIRREKSKVLWESSGLQLSDPCSQHGALKAAEVLLVMSHCLV